MLTRLSLVASLGVTSALTLSAQQTGSDTIPGVVKDATSAVAAAAKLIIVDTAPMTEHSMTTNDVGFSCLLKRSRVPTRSQWKRTACRSGRALTTLGLSGGQDGSINPIDSGLRDSVDLYQDGQVLKNRETEDWSGRLPGVDAIGDVRVETNLSSAKFDPSGAAILSARSGSKAVQSGIREPGYLYCNGNSSQKLITDTNAAGQKS